MSETFPPTIVGRCVNPECRIMLQSRRPWNAKTSPPGLTRNEDYTRHLGRMMCNRCYNRMRHHGSFEKPKRIERRVRRDDGKVTELVSREDAMTDWELLRSEGLTPAIAAPRIGMSVAALEKAMSRARKDGDPRGLRSPHDTLNTEFTRRTA